MADPLALTAIDRIVFDCCAALCLHGCPGDYDDMMAEELQAQIDQANFSHPHFGRIAETADIWLAERDNLMSEPWARRQMSQAVQRFSVWRCGAIKDALAAQAQGAAA